MLKKIISITLLLCLMFSINVMAENENPVSENAAQTAQSNQDNMGMPAPGERQGRTPPSMPNGEMMPEGMNRGQRPSGDFVPQQNGGEFIPPQGEFALQENNNVTDNTEAAPSQTEVGEATKNTEMPNNNQQFDGQMPGAMGAFPGNLQSFNGQGQQEVPEGFLGFIKTYATPITSVIFLALAFIFVIFYKRKNY